MRLHFLYVIGSLAVLYAFLRTLYLGPWLGMILPGKRSEPAPLGAWDVRLAMWLAILCLFGRPIILAWL